MEEIENKIALSGVEMLGLLVTAFALQHHSWTPADQDSYYVPTRTLAPTKLIAL